MTTSKRPPRPKAAPDPTSPPLGDLVSRSLEVGYRAFDDYVQHGQRIVQRVSDGGSREQVAADVQDLGTRMMRHASDLLGTWLDVLGNPASAATPPQADAAPPTAAAVEPRRLRLRIVAARPTETVVDLRDGSVPPHLAARELRSASATAPPLAVTTRDVAAEGVVAVDVVVPDDQPAGDYDVLFLDGAHGAPLGALRVTVR